MTKQTPEETRKTNESISRAGETHQHSREKTSLAGRHGLAARAIIDDDAEKSETEKAAERASRNDEGK